MAFSSPIESDRQTEWRRVAEYAIQSHLFDEPWLALFPLLRVHYTVPMTREKNKARKSKLAAKFKKQSTPSPITSAHSTPINPLPIIPIALPQFSTGILDLPGKLCHVHGRHLILRR